MGPDTDVDVREGTSHMMLPEAVALGHGLVLEAALRTGSRVLFVKGLSFELHGLRAPRTPADVDVLVDPDGFETVCRQLEQWGWHERMSRVEGRPEAHHSTTYIHPRWPCDIDVHLWFPGFLAPTSEVFDALWERRVEMPVAAQRVPVTDVPGSVLVMALHSLRSTADDPRHVSELRHLIEIVGSWDEAARLELAALARAAGCVRTLEPFWRAIWLDAGDDHPAVAQDALAAWRRKLDGTSTGTRVWLGYIWAGGPRQALRRIRDALWLDEEVMRGSLRIAPGPRALNRARMKRLVRGLVRLPAGLVRSVWGGRSVARGLGTPTGSARR